MTAEFRAKRSVILVLSCALLLGVGVASAAATPLEPRAPRADCVDVLVLGARGSGQPQAGSSSDAGTGLGPQVASVYTRLSSDLPGRSVGSLALQYPALQAELLALDPARYFAGLEAGVASAKKSLRRQAIACPRQRFVLAGYSQGAMVMHRVLHDLTRSADASAKRVLRRIDASVLLADGDRQSSERMTSLGNAGSGRGISYAAPADSKVRRGRLPSGMTARVFSVCEQADVICDYRSLLQSNAAGIDGSTVHVTSYTGSPDVLRAADAAAALVR